MSLDGFISEAEQSSLRAMKRTEGWPIIIKLIRARYEAALRNLESFANGDEALERRGYSRALGSLLEDLLSLHILTAEVDANAGRAIDRNGYDPSESRGGRKQPTASNKPSGGY